MDGNTEKQPEWGYLRTAVGPGLPRESVGASDAQPDASAAAQQSAPQGHLANPTQLSPNYQQQPYADYASRQSIDQKPMLSDGCSCDYPLAPGLPKGKAIASLVLGIVSLFPGTFIAGALAIVIGGSAVTQCSRDEAAGKGMAVAGVALGVVGIIVWMLLAPALNLGAP
jgi:hypothetical protein